jgi:hypothetical protein
MTKLKTKLPRYVFITKFGVYRFIRNIPKDGYVLKETYIGFQIYT